MDYLNETISISDSLLANRNLLQFIENNYEIILKNVSKLSQKERIFQDFLIKEVSSLDSCDYDFNPQMENPQIEKSFTLPLPQPQGGSLDNFLPISTNFSENFPLEEQKNEILLNNESSKRFRGPYKKYDLETKKMALEMYSKEKKLRKVGRNLGIPYNTLKKWIKIGPGEKNTGKRKNAEFFAEERKLHDWIAENSKDGKKPAFNLVKMKAKEIFGTKRGNFKASRTWIENLNRRMGKVDEIQEEIL